MRNADLARAQFADDRVSITDKVATLLNIIAKYGQTVNAPWVRKQQNLRTIAALNELEHSMIAIAELDEQSTPFAMLTPGYASLIYEYALDNYDLQLSGRLDGVKPGCGAAVEHLNAWCEEKAALPEDSRLASPSRGRTSSRSSRGSQY